MTDHGPDLHHPPGLAPDDDRRPLIAILRCRQLLAASLTNDVSGMHVTWRLALAELGDTEPVLHGVLALIAVYLPEGDARDQLLADTRALIPEFVLQLDAASPACAACGKAPATLGAWCADCIHQAAMEAWQRDHGQPDR